ncbi:cell division cycle protein 123 homolog isoform X1 [Acipenser ruthenus]|uniref:cell division cycle protein 123 homolog isoform X1 n=1 Tax=Acipenser ruthenus TaxID=7906 RepID=UPI001560B4D7|nr:cell division cycle protein 123 homolog isoform X1 [Acipenser ruthenus]
MKKEQVVNCQFSVWYPTFKKHTIKSLILPLPQNVIDYLLDDGTLVVSGREEPPSHSQNNDSGEEEEIQWSDDETTATATAPEFPEFTSKVQEAINTLDGSVFPKLNWSSPRDANWIAMNSSLQCQSLSDIFLLFKSSDFIAHDLTQPFIHCNDDSPDPKINYELVLRKWCELIPGGEFRCFVKENKLIGISQRDYTQYYDHISKQEDDTCRSIQDFFQENIQYKFLDEDFVFDVYRDSRGRVWLIDFNPFGEVTDSLLFTWEELTSGTNLRDENCGGETTEQDSPAFRYTTSDVTVQPSPCLSYRIPRDFVDLSTGEDTYKLIDFLKLKKNQQDDESDEDM